ncbi:MAG: tetratricopeptide repeat protein [Nevskiales bacterium]
MSTPPSFFAELQRRHVYKVGAMYGVAGWLLVQIATQVFPFFDISNAAVRWVVIAVVAGFVPALVLAWLFDITPQGIVRTGDTAASSETPAVVRQRRGMDRRLNYVLGLLLVFAIGYFAAERLGWIAGRGGAAAATDKSIAVLPFENLSDDKANGYFADGIQDEVLTRLAKVGALKVISRTSTQQYAARPGNLPEIAKQLGVANILEGSVQKIGDAVHINVQLIRAATDEHLWAESYNRKLDDIFGVEGEVAQAIAERMNATLTGAEKQKVTAKLTGNAAAYEAYLRGLTSMDQVAALGPNTQQAIAAFAEAVRLDPDFAEAWAYLSRVHAFAYLTFDASAAHKQGAREAFDQVTRLAPGSDAQLNAEGFYRYWVERDYSRAKGIFEELLQRQPNDAWVIYALAAVDRRQGHWKESLPGFMQALRLNPRDKLVLADASLTALALRDLPAAQDLIDQALAIAPDDTGNLTLQVLLLQMQGHIEQAQEVLDRTHPAQGDDFLVTAFSSTAILARRYDAAIGLLQSQLKNPDSLGTSLGQYQAQLGDLQRLAGDPQAARQSYEQARTSLRAALRDEPDNPALVSNLAQAEAGLGNRTEALTLGHRAVELIPASRDALIGPAYEDTLARLQARFGDKDAAIAAVRHLLTIPYALPVVTPTLLRLDPDWDKLRDDPRFQELLGDASPTAAAPGKP